MAKTTGKIRGTAILVDADGTTILCTTNATLNITNERIETSCKDNDGAVTYTPGSQDWSLQIDGLTKFDTASNFSLVAALASNQAEVEWIMQTSNAEDPIWTGTGFVGDFTENAANGEISNWSITVAPTGPLVLTNT